MLDNQEVVCYTPQVRFPETYSYWYALMREVAVLETGNFRGVCPIQKPGDRQTCPKLPPLQLVGYRIVLSCSDPGKYSARYFRFFKREGWKHPGTL